MPAPRVLSLPEAGRPVDVLCLGHALVDRLAHAMAEDVARSGMELGAMTLVDGPQATEIERALDAWAQVAGGSAANTAAGIASLGGSPGFVGAVGDDDLGAWYAADLASSGVRCTLDTLSGSPTGLCHVLITPGGERSMATSLGAAGSLRAGTVDRASVGSATAVYLEGYLLDAPTAAGAVERALEQAAAAGTLVALTMSDPFVVTRHRERIVALVEAGNIDLLFGNEEEARELSGAGSLDESLAWLEARRQAAVVTRGAAGAVVAASGGRLEIAAQRVPRVEDTTGAGDLFAAGCLYGITHASDWSTALRLGAAAAAEVISHVGARPQASLRAIMSPDLLEQPAGA